MHEIKDFVLFLGTSVIFKGGGGIQIQKRIILNINSVEQKFNKNKQKKFEKTIFCPWPGCKVRPLIG
jgi:hypothetical protein